MTDMPAIFDSLTLPYAFAGPSCSGVIRQQPADFVVEEIPGFEPEGDGDHVFLTIRKTGMTTPQVVNRLKDFTGVHPREIGYAGLKDKHAVTTQPFSVNMAGRPEPDWRDLNSDTLEVLEVKRHRRKLKRGVLKGNRFILRVTSLVGDSQQLEATLQQIALNGVPNFFGEQRFGREQSNLENAWRLFNDRSFRVDRQERGMLFSAVRSMVFNALLAERVKQGNWQLLLPGEVINLDGTERHFLEPVDDTLLRRATEMDVHGTGPLPGKSSRALEPVDRAGELERSILDRYGDWVKPLTERGLEHARRPLRVAVRDLIWQIDSDALTLSFSLSSGAYATTVLRELVDFAR